METKLKEYRLKKARKEAFEKVKNKITGVFERMIPSVKVKEDEIVADIKDDVSYDLVSDTSDTLSTASDDIELCSSNTWAKLTLYGSLWLFLFVLAIHAEFGAVYFVISVLYIIWNNTRTSPKRAGEVSAYSVFNPNCEAIDGSIKAEQIEKEIRFGGMF